MNLSNLKQIFQDAGCEILYVKILSPNDNSKNQVYLGGSFEVLNILPVSEIKSEAAGSWNRERFKAYLNFSWIGEDGNHAIAPHAQLILYPKYPEVRFSGFLLNCQNPPSLLMTQRLAGRLLFMSVRRDGSILGYVASPNSEIAQEFKHIKVVEDRGLFKVIHLQHGDDTKRRLLQELYRVHLKQWIASKRLDRTGKVLPCTSSNCGGYTLEAELGIKPNGYAEPDFLGWEIKQFSVSNFLTLTSSVVTLMTPEPTDGYYVVEGVEAFVRTYGYMDLKGRSDRMNFGGIHKAGVQHSRTNLRLELLGFDKVERKIRNTEGKIVLLDSVNNEAASWSFSSLLLHWNKKHNKACYVPSITDSQEVKKYKFGDKVILGEGTDFQLFLSQMASGNIYYDPGIKLENMSFKPTIKRRSQFRIKSQHLPTLYKNSEIVNLEI